MTSMVKSDEAVDEDELSLVTGEAKLLFKTADILLSLVSDEGRASGAAAYAAALFRVCCGLCDSA